MKKILILMSILSLITLSSCFWNTENKKENPENTASGIVEEKENKETASWTTEEKSPSSTENQDEIYWDINNLIDDIDKEISK